MVVVCLRQARDTLLGWRTRERSRPDAGPPFRTDNYHTDLIGQVRHGVHRFHMNERERERERER